MKVHIINLEPEDDHASARDRISSARAPKVVLVWPRRGTPLNRQLDLTLVLRHATRHGLELGLLTYDPKVLAHAERLGIPVFDSLERLPPGTWTDAARPASFRREGPSLAELRERRDAEGGPFIQLGERGRWVAVGISIAAVLAIAASILPRAEIVLSPTTVPFERRLSFSIDPQGLSQGSVAGHLVSTEVSGSTRLDTSGRVRLPREIATGEVELTNLTGDELTVPAGTGLRAGEIRYLTTDEVLLEAGEGSTALVSVMAAEAGITGNVAAGAIDSVEGALGFSIAVHNPERTSGGRDHSTASVRQSDMDAVRELLEAELILLAEKALRAQLDTGIVLAPGSLRIAETIEESFDVNLGEPAESVGLSSTLRVEGLAYSEASVLEAAEGELISGFSKDQHLIPNSLTLEPIDASADWPAVEILFNVEGSLAEITDQSELRRMVVGDPKARAEAQLGDLIDLERAPKIATSPSWMPWVPWLGMRVDIKWVWETG